MDINKLKLSITEDNVNIYIEHDYWNDTDLCYWHVDEWKYDSKVALNIFKAIDTFHRNPKAFEDLGSLEFWTNNE